MSKCCKKCKDIKELDCFYNYKKNEDGKNDTCKACIPNYYQKKRKYKLEYQRKYDREHKQEKMAYQRQYRKKQRKTNPQFKIQSKLRCRLHHALKGTVKSVGTMELLGCDIDYLIKYLKHQLQPGMTLDDVQIDHMMPCASFDLTKVEQQKACFHYTNLQPLSPQENGSKGAKIVYDMVWHNNQWYIRDNPHEIYRSRANILPVTLPVLNLSNNSVQNTLLDEITAMSKKIEERLNKINMLLVF